jgi:hypothetical protein
MLNSKYHFALVLAIAVFPINLPKAANAQTGYAGPYGGYYVIPGSDQMPPLPSPDNPNVSDPAPQIRPPNRVPSTPLGRNHYPKDFVQKFISGCAPSTGSAVCFCLVDKMQAKYSFEELQELYESKDPKLREVDASCVNLAR